MRVPIGVIGIIYESRPNVTADAGGLCLKAGNAAILRAGSDAHHSASAIHACLAEGLKRPDCPRPPSSSCRRTDRDAVGQMLKGLDGAIDVIVPRGGKSLVERVQKEARVPVFAHLEGICHTYVDQAADLAMAKEIVLNAKMRRTGVCGATECLLVDKAAPADVSADAGQGAARRRLRGARRCGDAEGRRRASRPRKPTTTATEFLDSDHRREAGRWR